MHHKEELVIPFDVDNTLLLDVPDGDYGVKKVNVYDPYDKKWVLRVVHIPHLKLLRNYLQRGARVIVWSKNGNRWVKSALLSLGIDLKHPQLIILTKPLIYVDDEPCSNWMGHRVEMSSDSTFGNDIEVKTK